MRELNPENIQRRQLKLVKSQCDQQVFFLKQNQENYQRKILEVEGKRNSEKESKINRKRILEEKKLQEKELLEE